MTGTADLRAALIELHAAVKAHRCDQPQDPTFAPIQECGDACWVEAVLAGAEPEPEPDFSWASPEPMDPPHGGLADCPGTTCPFRAMGGTHVHWQDGTVSGTVELTR